MQYSHYPTRIRHLHVRIYILPKWRHCGQQPDRWKKQTDGNRYCPRELSPAGPSTAAFNDLDGFESCSLKIFVRQTAQLELTSPTFLALSRLSAESSHACPSPVPTTRSIFRQNDALYFSHHCRGTIGRTPKSEEVF